MLFIGSLGRATPVVGVFPPLDVLDAVLDGRLPSRQIPCLIDRRHSRGEPFQSQNPPPAERTDRWRAMGKALTAWALPATGPSGQPGEQGEAPRS